MPIVSVAVWMTVFLVSTAVSIYFNRLQNTGALELNDFAFATFHLMPDFASMSFPQVPFDSTELAGSTQTKQAVL